MATHLARFERSGTIPGSVGELRLAIGAALRRQLGRDHQAVHDFERMAPLYRREQLQTIASEVGA